MHTSAARSGSSHERSRVYRWKTPMRHNFARPSCEVLRKAVSLVSPVLVTACGAGVTRGSSLPPHPGRLLCSCRAVDGRDGTCATVLDNRAGTTLIIVCRDSLPHPLTRLIFPTRHQHLRSLLCYLLRLQSDPAPLLAAPSVLSLPRGDCREICSSSEAARVESVDCRSAGPN